MRFKAKIISIGEGHLSLSERDNVMDREFYFSRTKIIFPSHKRNRHYFITGCANNAGALSHGIKYVFDKTYNEDTEKTSFSIKLESHQGCGSDLQIDTWNRIKCNWIHKRYWIINNKEELYKIVFAAVVGAIISALAAISGYDKGYDQGYENGLKRGMQQLQDTIPK